MDRTSQAIALTTALETHSVRKYVFSNRVIDNWNLLSASCVNCSTVNTFKKILLSELESEAVKFTVSQL